MSEVIDAPASAPAAPAAAPAVAAPAVAAAESLLSTPAAEPEFAFAEKVLVKAADGTEDWKATAAKAEQARQHLEKRLGAGDAPPKDVTGYEFTPPEDLKDFSLNTERIDGFKAEALKQGVTPAQFKWMMDSYLKAVPDLMEGAAKMSAAEAKTALQAVWAKPGELEAGLAHANKAAQALPADLQAEAASYGTDPVVLRLLAWVGAQMGEDKPISTSTPTLAQSDVSKLMASEAYTNARHPEHAKVSEQVRKVFAGMPGADQPI